MKRTIIEHLCCAVYTEPMAKKKYTSNEPRVADPERNREGKLKCFGGSQSDTSHLARRAFGLNVLHDECAQGQRLRQSFNAFSRRSRSLASPIISGASINRTSSTPSKGSGPSRMASD